jgi:DNA-binding CsgD family transcriptional regulator
LKMSFNNKKYQVDGILLSAIVLQICKTLFLPINPFLMLNENNKKSPLTKREMEVLELIINEKTNNETAQILHLSVNTVETHRKNIIRKLNIKSVIGLYHWAKNNQAY